MSLGAALLLSVVLSSCSGGRGGAAGTASPTPTADAGGAPDAPIPDGPCASDADCAAVQQDESCCDICGWRAFTQAGLAALRARCAPRELRCPAIDCPYQARHAVCEAGRCTTAPDEPPRTAPASCRPATAEERAAILAAERHLAATGQLRGSPPPPPPPPPPPRKTPPGGRVIVLENIDVSRESLEPHAWGVIHARGDGNPNLLVVFRFDRDFLGRIYPEARIDAQQNRAGHAVEIGPGPRVLREPHSDFLLEAVERVCASP